MKIIATLFFSKMYLLSGLTINQSVQVNSIIQAWDFILTHAIWCIPTRGANADDVDKAGYTLIVKYAKTFAKCEKWKVNSRIFRVIFLVFRARFRFLHFAPGLAFLWKVNGFCSLFFCRINKTQNSHEIRKVYSECFVFCGVLRKNTREMQNMKVCSQPRESLTWTDKAYSELAKIMKKAVPD